VVVGEGACRGVHSVDIEKRYKENLTFFFVSFLSAVGAILDSGGIHHPPRCCVGHPFSQGASLQVILVSFRRGGWELIICMFACIVAVLWGGHGWGCEGGVCGVGQV
jgi:hypothetical protein